MRNHIITFLRVHPIILNWFWKLGHVFFTALSAFIPIEDKTMLITSFAGRKYDDSPKALYEKIIQNSKFYDWKIKWAFVNPDDIDMPGLNKIKVDTWAFFMALLRSKVWISNSGMDRNLGINRKGTIKVETWHGTPLKKIGIDQNSGILGNYKPRRRVDTRTIRCAQSKYDREIFQRIFNASESSFLMCDLPRNDELYNASEQKAEDYKRKLNIPVDKKVILYMPTYREYLLTKSNKTFLAPPMNLEKWEEKLGEKYVLLMRAHYAVNEALDLKENEFVRDVSNYPYINELYIASDLLLSDYSSAFFDYSILQKPMFCFAYDLKEYERKRGLYLDLEKELPCSIDKTEDEVIDHIVNLNKEEAIDKVKSFKEKYAPFAGNACNTIIDEIIKRV